MQASGSLWGKTQIFMCTDNGFSLTLGSNHARVGCRVLTLAHSSTCHTLANLSRSGTADRERGGGGGGGGAHPQLQLVPAKFRNNLRRVNFDQTHLSNPRTIPAIPTGVLSKLPNVRRGQNAGLVVIPAPAWPVSRGNVHLKQITSSLKPGIWWR